MRNIIPKGHFGSTNSKKAIIFQICMVFLNWILPCQFTLFVLNSIMAVAHQHALSLSTSSCLHCFISAKLGGMDTYMENLWPKSNMISSNTKI